MAGNPSVPIMEECRVIRPECSISAVSLIDAMHRGGYSFLSYLYMAAQPRYGDSCLSGCFS